ncbi:hypothetical protein [Dactylosporangium matsuzakiense]|uniref:Thrombospondin n=1 Tax=Dactylosporangium matsuzakiense TaxID=53360 RepID=A0A9W6NM52_9ACTN|nr:hypothetical protein [Dactylosporangium matsuzakiense]UWZ46809.1 hypothetical protein Dmats_10560 [Dactylosporangium matsuzakiense]GLL01783.1 hypothetical protein GCM10017581_035250 [Dactylosporangium matsuzakiense]
MARIGQLFGGRSATDRDGDGVDDRAESPTVDRNHDGVDDRAETASETRTWRLKSRHDKDGDGVDDRAEAKTTGTIPAVGVMDRETEKPAMRPTIDREPVTVPEPVTTPEPVPVRQAPARVSMLAALGVMLGVAGVAIALTGLLATWAIPVGALGLLFSFGGIIAGVRPNVAGRGLGTLGVLISGTAVVFGILAMTGQVSWLDTDVDQVARLNTWLDAQFPWMKDW